MIKLIAKNEKFDNCSAPDDIKQRYENLDVFFDYLKHNGRWMTQITLRKVLNYRDNEGVYVHIGHNGELIFGGGGNHLLAIAKILEMKRIPAQIGVVHENYFSSGQFYNNNIKVKKQELNNK